MTLLRLRGLSTETRAGFALAALVFSGCAGVPKVVRNRPAAAHGAAAIRVDFARPARWFPVSDAMDSKVSESDTEGSVRSVEHGLRLVEHPDGRLERALDVLPQVGTVVSLRLPARFGGGFLFSATDGTSTLVYRAPEWTDRLVPLVRLPFEANSIKLGFDRLYALSNATHAAVAFNPSTGNVDSLGALPASPAYGGMAFADGWLGAVEVDVRGVLVTFDAGLGWHAVRMPVSPPGVDTKNGRVVLSTARGTYALLPSGELARIDATSSDSVFGDMPGSAGADLDEGDTLPAAAPPSFRQGALGGRPLEVAVLRGYPVGSDEAVALSNGALARISLKDGSVLGVDEQASSAGDVCQGVHLGTGIGFVCGEDRGRSRVYAFEPPLGLDLVLEFDGPRYIAASGNGALVIRGSCSAAAGASAATYCVRSVDGSVREVNVEGDLGAERVIGLASGEIAVVVPPRLGAQGLLHIVDRAGRTKTTPLSFISMPTEARDVVTRGFWLDGMVEAEPGVVAGWVVGAQHAGPPSPGATSSGSSDFVGIRLGFDGKVRTGDIQSGLERAGLSGALALVTDEHGGAFESVDYGATWSEVTLPEVGDLLSDARADHPRGCTPVGCSVGSWLRVGWGTKKKDGDLVPAPEPPKARFEPAPIIGWGLECAFTGEAEGPNQVASASRERVRRPQLAARPQGRVAQELETSAWRPFLGMPGPELGRDDIGFDFGTEDQVLELRGYAWGNRSAAWDRAGTWLVRVIDRFEVKNAIWSTAPSRTPWPDAAGAAEVFGSDPSHRVANDWGGLYDPGGEGVLVTMRTGNALSMAVAEKNRAIVMVGNADDFALDRPAGAAKVLGRWYVGSVPGPRSFHIFGIEGGTMHSVGTYPRYADANTAPARVVRTVRGDALGIWVVAKGQAGSSAGGETWFVYPIDPESGEAGQPLVVGRSELIRTPRPCGPDEDGWLLVNDAITSVWRLEFPDVSSEPSVAKLEVRFVAGSAGLCVDALAGQVEGDPPKDLGTLRARTPPRQSVELALTDRATDRRWGFRCTP